MEWKSIFIAYIVMMFLVSSVFIVIFMDSGGLMGSDGSGSCVSLSYSLWFIIILKFMDAFLALGFLMCLYSFDVREVFHVNIIMSGLGCCVDSSDFGLRVVFGKRNVQRSANVVAMGDVLFMVVKVNLRHRIEKLGIEKLESQLTEGQ